MNIYEARWNNVLKWAKKVKQYYDTGNYMISWENNEDYYPNEFRFIIDEENRSIELYGKNTRQGIYEYDLDWDHGSYTSINETNKMLAEIKLYSMVQIEI